MLYILCYFTSYFFLNWLKFWRWVYVYDDTGAFGHVQNSEARTIFFLGWIKHTHGGKFNKFDIA